MSSTTERNAALLALIRPIRTAIWQADYPLNFIERGLAAFANDCEGLDLEPDFQRGHVWTREQQERFIEAMYRGLLPANCLFIQFNCPHWEHDEYVGDLPRGVQCVDGLQRLTTLRKFMKGEICAFGLTVDQFKGTSFDAARTKYMLKFAMHSFTRRAELLQYYLDFNDGGTPHSAQELARVRGLLTQSAT